MQSPRFPANFLWGASSASYQVEGAWNTDGRGESIWDRYSHTPGKVLNGDTGDIACDQYHLYPQDIALMRRMGLKAYRFSIAWPRVLPTGFRTANPAGLDYYDRLVDALLGANIQPFLTLHHWDLPQALYETGGWLNRDTGHYFADYAAMLVKYLGDRVPSWTTFNEPAVIAYVGYLYGEHAPGIKDRKQAYQVVHNLNVAHGLATQAIRAANSSLKVGIVLNQWNTEPASDDPEDVAAAETSWYANETGFLHPIFRGHYHPLMEQAVGADMPEIRPGDMAIISQQLDFLGLNNYSRTVVGAKGQVERVAGSEYTEMGWEVCAPALRRLLNRMHNDYHLPPIYITENGAAFVDTLTDDGKVHDDRRTDYLRQHIAQVRLAMQDGVDIRGYFAWSFSDNFEWSLGYSKRFGLVYVDYANLKRYLKDSGEWYSQVIAGNQVF